MLKLPIVGIGLVGQLVLLRKGREVRLAQLARAEAIEEFSEGAYWCSFPFRKRRGIGGNHS